MNSNIQSAASLAMTSYDQTTTHEWDHSDLDMDEILTAFAGVLMAQSWSPYVIYNSMKEFAEEQLECLQCNNEGLKAIGAALPPAPGDPDDYDDIMLGQRY